MKRLFEWYFGVGIVGKWEIDKKECFSADSIQRKTLNTNINTECSMYEYDEETTGNNLENHYTEGTRLDYRFSSITKFYLEAGYATVAVAISGLLLSNFFKGCASFGIYIPVYFQNLIQLLFQVIAGLYYSTNFVKKYAKCFFVDEVSLITSNLYIYCNGQYQRYKNMYWGSKLIWLFAPILIYSVYFYGSGEQEILKRGHEKYVLTQLNMIWGCGDVLAIKLTTSLLLFFLVSAPLLLSVIIFDNSIVNKVDSRISRLIVSFMPQLAIIILYFGAQASMGLCSFKYALWFVPIFFILYSKYRTIIPIVLINTIAAISVTSINIILIGA